MNTIKSADELRPEYDMSKLQVRRLGPGRKKFGDIVRLEPDVLSAFPSADAVNEALRYFIEIAHRSASLTKTSNQRSPDEAQRNPG